MLKLPTDKQGKEVIAGCTIHLDHSNKDRKVTVLDYIGNGTWIVGCDEGGSFLLPQSRDNITVLADDIERLAALEDLVKDMKMHICRIYHDKPCAVCGAYDEMLGICVYGKRMHELGVEVDDG